MPPARYYRAKTLRQRYRSARPRKGPLTAPYPEPRHPSCPGDPGSSHKKPMQFPKPPEVFATSPAAPTPGWHPAPAGACRLRNLKQNCSKLVGRGRVGERFEVASSFIAEGAGAAAAAAAAAALVLSSSSSPSDSMSVAASPITHNNRVVGDVLHVYSKVSSGAPAFGKDHRHISRCISRCKTSISSYLRLGVEDQDHQSLSKVDGETAAPNCDWSFTVQDPDKATGILS